MKSDERTNENLNVEVKEFYVDFPLYIFIAQLVHIFVGNESLKLQWIYE